MKFSLSATFLRAAWQNNKPFVVFLFYLFLIHSVLKIIFYQYNHQLLFDKLEATGSLTDTIRLVKWSLIYDLLTLLCINAGLLLLLQAGRFVPAKFSSWITLPVFMIINTVAILLNVLDIFYFRFHFQRSNADLLYVIDHPFKQIFHFNIIIILLFAIGVAGVIYWVWRLHKKLYTSFSNKRHCNSISVILLLCFCLAFIFRTSFAKVLVPAYPLVEINTSQLPVVQNSFHCFAYSVFREGDAVTFRNYFTPALCDSLLPVKKSFQESSVGKKNIVLFIMESVPYDFFDTTSPYKVKMLFFDSLLEKSSFFKNAFCYSHESNKGITAILAGIPTLTDIPLYHSRFVNMPLTAIGKALAKNSYQSLFCIGDEYDNFGFAKCANWLGIDKYYSEEDIPGYKDLPSNSMGLQDEAVLPFFFQKLNETTKPFFAVNFNISTHYSYDLPPSYHAKFPAHYTDPMKSMQYYDHCLQQFFNKAKMEPWFNETVFIFCSDHWLFPEGIKGTYNAFSGYHIPIIIFDPSSNKKESRNETVSQFDIMGPKDTSRAHDT